VSCGGFGGSFSTLPGRSLWIDMSEVQPSSDVVITFSSAPRVSVSLIMAGTSAEIPNGGVTGGQNAITENYNTRTLSSVDEFDNPTTQILRPSKPRVNWNFPNLQTQGVENFRTRIDFFYSLLRNFGVAPAWDDTTSSGFRSYGVYAPNSDSRSYDSRTNLLVSWRLSAKAVM